MNTVADINEYKENLKNDGRISIATGKSRYETKWKNKMMTWSALVAKLKTPVVTPETYAEYKKMGKAEQDRIKDVGGYVGGTLKDGKRKSDSVTGRQLITLDLDFAPADFFEDLELQADYACCVYSTHKHSKGSPRYRLLIPLKRTVSPDEYEAVSRKIADDINIDYFDDTTYQPSRLMYWPSVSSDGEYFFDFIDEPFLDPDKVLAQYDDWTDSSFWPESSRASGIRKKLAEKQGDPTEKRGLIGAFCRTYDIPEAIDRFLSEIYIKCEKDNRYTYAAGSTAAGLVVYEDGKFAYSNHGTDPAGGRLCNSFDLVRIHLFGGRDENTSAETETTKLPSYKAMVELCREDKDTKLQLSKEIIETAKQEFDAQEEIESLQYDANGNLINSLRNITLLIKQDENLQGIFLNTMSGFVEVDSPLPWNSRTGQWRDVDDAQLQAYLEGYGRFSKLKVLDALQKVADDRARHPVQEYLNNLPAWDRVPRVDTLLIDYLGAEDTDYVRQVTRKTLCGAIYRILYPGCKFDTMLVLNGPQGIGKSTLISKLGKSWFNDSMSLSDTKDKTAAEKLQGYWILEIGELAGMRKTDIETLRSFITRQDDVFRASYGRRTVSHKRQCIFIGTTNAEDGYLRDQQGNRRFWDVKTPGGSKLKPWCLDEDTVDQIWAETMVYVNAKEPVVLQGNVAKIAEEKQREALESDPREGMVREYLDTLLPEKWYEWNLPRRRSYIQGTDFEDEKGVMERKEVCYAEIWYECFGKAQGEMQTKDSYAIASILNKLPNWKKSDRRKRIAGYGQQRVYERECDNKVS